MGVLFTDAFTYANGNISTANANWVNVPAAGGSFISINTNTAGISATTDDILCRYSAVTSAASHVYVQATHAASFNTGGVGVGMGVALSIDTGGANTCIRLITSLAGWELARFNAGSFTSLGSGSATTFTIADKFRLEYTKATGAWALYKFTGASPGAAFATGTDPSPLSNIQFGICYSSIGNSASVIDNFEFGDFAAAGTTLSPAEGSVVITGQTPALSKTLAPSSGSVVISGNIPGITLTLVPGTGSVVITGQSPTVAQAVVISPALASVVITGQTPTLITTLVPSVGSVVITGNTPSITKILFPTEGSVVISGNTPALSLSLGPATGSVVITGNTPSLSLSLVPTAGSVVITGQVPTVNNTGSTILTPAEGQVIITGNAPTITLTIVIPASGQVIISGNAPSINPAPPGVDDQRRTMFMAKHVRKRLIRRGR